MLPLLQAYEAKDAIIEYLRATFHFREKEVSDAFYDFIESEENGISRGPYLSLKTPFTSAESDGSDLLDITPGYSLYKHQYLSFSRLTTKGGHTPEPTLLTTGTGSGKTECFLYPLLDYCYQWRQTHPKEREGIKAIILYPMNALASDQAKRLAEAIHRDNRLRGSVTAGLFIGEGPHKAQSHPFTMGEDHIIEDRRQILETPPDILLTNFKMLDYALMKHNYAKLWAHNRQSQGMLKFIILDEIHTYDGAQGTDVAHLLRRLKLKLRLTPGQLCPVGTSATIGSGRSTKLIRKYASDIFGEAFGEDSIIGEDRMEVEQLCSRASRDFIPSLESLRETQFGLTDDYSHYIDRQVRLWGLQRDQLAEGLASLTIVADLTAITYDRYVTVRELLSQLAERNKSFGKLPSSVDPEDTDNSPRLAVLSSLISLITEAKKGTTIKFPFLYLQVQLWFRELSGFLRLLTQEPTFTWRKDINRVTKKEQALPAYFCRECGSSGWIAYKPTGTETIDKDAGRTAVRFIANNENCYLLNRYSPSNNPIDEYQGQVQEWYIDPRDLHKYDKPGDEGEHRLHVYAMRKLSPGSNNRNPHTQQICPCCGSENSLAIIGTKVATLASVAISQVMSSDLDEEPETSRKILAFTNSVQDAAHQAGFFEARNYRFSLRNAIQNCIKDLRTQGKLPISLEELQREFITYWKSRLHFEESQEPYVYRFFPPDRLGEIDLASDFRVAAHAFQDKFIEELDQRISWEIASEFGFNARIGRTLEKSGASATYFDRVRLRETYDGMKEWLSDNKLGALTCDHFIKFLNGVLHRIRMRGAVDHHFLRSFREVQSDLFHLNNRVPPSPLLCHRFGARGRYPKPLATTPITGGSKSILDTTYVGTRVPNWYTYYFLKCFTEDLHSYGTQDQIPQALLNDFYQKLFDTLCQVGICNRSDRETDRNYCLSPSAIMISDRVRHILCHDCTSRLCVGGTADDEVSEGTPCIEYRCGGKYTTVKGDEIQRYYYNVYNRQLAPRIYSHEHTGILDRQKRESIEYQFKSNQWRNNINTLVATSTLEMGIDIGDLNVALNTSVPPMPANYIQRVGRAGRKSGAALIIDFARNEYHDLFYYAEPREMMEGKINTPGCYLSAVDILRRHFLAFVLDTWTGIDPAHQIPARVSMLPPRSFMSEPKSFYCRLCKFINEEAKDLEQSFRSQYTEDVRESLDELFETVKSGEFTKRITQEFQQLHDKYFWLIDRIREIRKYIAGKQLGETDPEWEVLDTQIRTLHKTRRVLMSRQVIEYMTDCGLLPNYAFPETGVTLDATIIHHPASGQQRVKYRTEKISIQRPASLALRELAPGNHFYTQKYHIRVSGLSTLNWGKAVNKSDDLVPLHFCSQCDYIERDTQATSGAPCPICGDPSFGSTSNVHLFARLTEVQASDRKEAAVLDDRSDDRDRHFYTTSKHFLFEEAATGYGLRTIPFGIEYCKGVDIIDINLGEADQHDSRSITINEHKDVPTKGFVTCKYCGKSTSRARDLQVQRPEELHYAFCQNKGMVYQWQSDQYFEEVYLYHTFHTEALKILLPIQEIDTEVTTELFIAGISLGLRDYFAGNPDHLSIESYKQFNKETGKFDRYVILYDRIPGGTGYLRQISTPSEFEKILQHAWSRIHNCDCQHHGKDGCYHCILSYSNNRIHDRLSRQRADELFRRILDYCHDEVQGTDHWEQISRLSHLSSDGGLEESDLERRFIHALSRASDQVILADGTTHPWTFTQDEHAYHQQYLLRYEDQDRHLSFEVIPQYPLDSSEGVEYYTVADFLIRPVLLQEREEDGKWIDRDFSQLRGVAIYMDGYLYHASDKHNHFSKDLLKRQSIDRSRRYLSYTLTWADMDLFEESMGDTIVGREDPAKVRQLMTMSRRSGWLTCRNSMERLLHALSGLHSPQALREDLLLYLGLCLKGAQRVSGHLSVPLFPEEPWGSISLDIDPTARRMDYRVTTPGDYDATGGLGKEQWEDFWRAYSLLALYRGLGSEPTEAPTEEEQWEEIAEKFDDDLHNIVLELLRAGIDFDHTAGVALTDAGGQRKVCEAELVSQAHQFVFFPDDEEAARAAGYRVYEPEDFSISDIK